MHWVGKILSIVYGMPLITFIGYTPSANGTFRWRPSYLRERVNFRLFMGQRVFCRSQDVASLLRDATGGSVDVIHGILNTERVREAGELSEAERESLRRRFDFSDGERALIFVGRLVPIKNPVGALKTLASLPSDYVLLVVGDGPMDTAVREHAERAGVADRVRFAGKLPHDETLECIAWSDCLLLSSHEEAYPTAVFESLALGTDVVATPVGVLPDIEHERLHLGTLEEFPTLIKSGTSGIDEDVLNQYSMKRYTEEILTAFEELITD
jgi:glycosyltransferase involved in cell wall biosynthesis